MTTYNPAVLILLDGVLKNCMIVCVRVCGGKGGWRGSERSVCWSWACWRSTLCPTETCWVCVNCQERCASTGTTTTTIIITTTTIIIITSTTTTTTTTTTIAK